MRCSVVIAALRYFESDFQRARVSLHSVNEPVLLGDPARPPAARRLAFHRPRRHITTMPRRPTPPKKSTAAKFRNWRVAIMRSRAQQIGTVAAADGAVAEAEAVKAFDLSEVGARMTAKKPRLPEM
jgi:hypothetical protein